MTLRWFYFQDEACSEPQTREAFVRRILAGTIRRNALVMREDWNDWRPLVNCLAVLCNDASARKSREEFCGERRTSGPRAELGGTAQLSNEQATTDGPVRNISTSGLFVVTSRPVFRLGAQVTVVVNAPDLGLSMPLTARAEIVRFNLNRAFEVGYGLRFIDMAATATAAIARLITDKKTQPQTDSTAFTVLSLDTEPPAPVLSLDAEAPAPLLRLDTEPPAPLLSLDAEPPAPLLSMEAEPPAPLLSLDVEAPVHAASETTPSADTASPSTTAEQPDFPEIVLPEMAPGSASLYDLALAQPPTVSTAAASDAAASPPLEAGKPAPAAPSAGKAQAGLNLAEMFASPLARTGT